MDARAARAAAAAAVVAGGACDGGVGVGGGARDVGNGHREQRDAKRGAEPQRHEDTKASLMEGSGEARVILASILRLGQFVGKLAFLTLLQETRRQLFCMQAMCGNH